MKNKKIWIYLIILTQENGTDIFEFLIYIWCYILYSLSDISKLDCQKVKRNTKSEDYSWSWE